MKKRQFLIFTLLLVFIALLPTRATAQLKATFEGHTDRVWSVAFSPNGQTLASGSQDRTIRLWNPNNGNLKRTLTGHRDAVNSVAFSPDGRTLASGSWDRTIRLWNPNNGNLKRTLTEHTDGIYYVAFSPDGQTLASASADQTVRLWNPNNGKLKATLTGHTGGVASIAFSPDGRTLASGSLDQTIRLWNPNNGKLKATLTGHTGDISRMTFSPDGQTLVSASRDDTVRLWNPNNGKLKTTLTNRTGWAKPIVFSSDGATLLIGGHGISIWDMQASEYKKPLVKDITEFLSVVFSPNGQGVACGSTDSKVRLWEYNAADYEFPTITTNGMVRFVYFLPNDRPIRPERVAALRQLIRDAQQFYADQMESHGFGRKTFTVETDKDGEPVVHHIDGKFNEDYYNNDDDYGPDAFVWQEIVEHFADIQHVYFVAIDVSNELLGKGACGLGGPSYFALSGGFASVGGLALRHRYITQGEELLGGFAMVPASGICIGNNREVPNQWGATLHELGHAFGLDHDFREGIHSDLALAGSGRPTRLSKCAAEWLSVSRFFNMKPISSNTSGEIQLLSIRPYNKDVISLRFKVTDADGLHQAQLLVPDIIDGTGWGPYRLYDCKQLNGKTDTIESAVRTAELVDRVTLQIIDVNGNITWATLPIQLDEAVDARNVLDVNSDSIVNISDLKPIASRYGRRGINPADVNEDKVVNIADLLLVAASLSSRPQQAVDMFTATDVQKWLNDANQFGIENEYQLKGIAFLEHLLLVKVSDYQAGWSMFVGIDADVNAVYKRPSDVVETIDVTDINADGTVNKTDLLLLVAALGENPPTNSRTDVNGDGAVNVADLLLVIENLNDPVNAAAPSSKDTTAFLDPAMLMKYLNALHAESDGSPKYQQAIAFLQNLLAVTRPDKTQLLANYPNPFNPETWIPYQLAIPAEVTLRIYAVNGTLIRTLALGHQPAGMYHSKSRAAYWDGKNEVGEPVASGIYFYTLTAGEFTATQKMLVKK